MYHLQAAAARIHGRMIVNVTTQLADTCVYVDVADHYPGGQRRYVVDPGAAQVFIAEERRTPGPGLEMLVPRSCDVHIPDQAHKTIDIYVNEKKELTISVANKDLFNVYQLTGGINPNFKCMLLPANFPCWPSTHKCLGQAREANASVHW